MGNFSDSSVISSKIVYIAYENDEISAANHLFLALMLHGYTARMLQAQLADPTVRQNTIEKALATADFVIHIVSADQPSSLLQEQLDVATALAKPIVEVQPAAGTAMLAAAGLPQQPLHEEVPATNDWLTGKWRLKFFNEKTLAHGHGEYTFDGDGSMRGILNLLQGTASLHMGIAANWTLEQGRLQVAGLQQIKGMPTRLEYKMEMQVEQFNRQAAFSVTTPQGDVGVLQRAPSDNADQP